MTLRILALLGAAVLIAGCHTLSGDSASESGTAGPRGSIPGGGTKGKLDEAADKLLEADRAFSAKSLEAGTVPAFAEFLDDQGMQLPANGEPLVGRKAVLDGLAANGPSVLTWEPRYAEVFAPGNWGWTWGTWQLHEVGAGGRRLGQGKYINLWKKQPDGSWKVRMDTGNAQGTP